MNKTNSVSSGVGSVSGGWRKPTTSNNPVYNSVGSLASTNILAASSSVYEELPNGGEPPQHFKQKANPPPVTSSLSFDRTVTANVLYASAGGPTNTLPTKPTLPYNYRFAAFPEPVDKQTKCHYTGEGVILILAILVVLLAGAALAMSLLLWLQIIPIQNATPDFQPSTGTACPCDEAVNQGNRVTSLLSQVQSIQEEVNSLMMETNGNSDTLLSRLDLIDIRLKKVSEMINDNPSLPPVVTTPGESAAGNLSLPEVCTVMESPACALQSSSGTVRCGGAAVDLFQPVDNGDNFFVRSSCFLRPTVYHGIVNGTALSHFSNQNSGTTFPTNGQYNAAEMESFQLLASCFCALIESYPVPVQCVRRVVSCPQTLNTPSFSA